MPDTSDLRELADSIQIAQTESYDGHYADEQQLYNLLKDIFRSPDVLMKVTKPKTD